MFVCEEAMRPAKFLDRQFCPRNYEIFAILSPFREHTHKSGGEKISREKIMAGEKFGGRKLWKHENMAGENYGWRKV